jgi:hypothetical protein
MVKYIKGEESESFTESGRPLDSRHQNILHGLSTMQLANYWACLTAPKPYL